MNMAVVTNRLEILQEDSSGRHGIELLGRLLTLPKPFVDPLLLNQNAVMSLLNNATVVHHKDSITGSGRRKLVADHHDGSVILGSDGIKDRCSRVVVDARKGVIENQQRC